MNKNQNTRFQPSAATVAIIALMLEARVGDTVTYEQMQRAIRVPTTRDRLHGYISSARHHLLANYERVFDTVTRVGVKRLDDNEIVENSNHTIQTIRRRAQRETSRLAVVNLENLKAPEQAKHAVRMAALAVISGQMDIRTIRRLEGDRAGSTSPRDGLRRLRG